MKTRTLTALAIAGLAAATISTQANAAMITATFTGSVANGLDQIGQFGVAGADLTGAKVKSVYTFDTSVGTISPLAGGNQFVGGGSATVTIGAFSWILNADSFANPNIGATTLGLGLLDLEVASDGGNNSLESYVSGSLPGSVLPTDILTSFSTLDCVSSGRICGGALNLFNGTVSDTFGLTYDQVQYEVSTVSQTPIPGALPLFLSAIGGLGFAGWRRKQAGAAQRLR